MLLTSWLRGWFRRAEVQRDNGPRPKRRTRTHEARRWAASAIETLERRQLLTVFAVTTLNDVVDAGDGVMSLREAIIAANSAPGDDEINLASGTYVLSLSGSNAATGDLDITAGSVTIRHSMGATPVVIDANGGSPLGDRVFDVAMGAGLHLVDLTVRRGFLVSGRGVGIRSQGQLTLDRVSVLDGTSGIGAVDGGGIAIEGGFATIMDSVISNNTVSGNGGGLFVNGGSVTLIRSTLDGNEAGDFGGGIRNEGAGFVNVIASNIRNNSVISDGGGISNAAQSPNGALNSWPITNPTSPSGQWCRD